MTKRKASVSIEAGTESDQGSSTQDNNSNSTSATNTTTGASNQGNHNGTLAAGSGGGKQQHMGESNSSNNNKGKKERADNWSSAEIQILHRGIDSRRDIFYGPPNQATKKNRELAWEAIVKEVNSVSTTPRSLGQVMKKFKNEKCRAKRKFIDAEKDGHNNMNNNSNINSNNNTTNSNINLSAQNHANGSQQLQSQQQQHHMTTTESIPNQPSSINVVKLAPQNLAKTMIDLPSHVQQIQMPNDDMVLIVPPEMDGLLSGMNIVSDGNSHHFQKCTSNSTLNNQQHNHHGQHTIQALNTGQGIVNGTMSNGMMARTLPAGSMCSLVYSTGNEVCGTDQHIANSLSGTNQLATNHISVNAQNLMHHRGPVDQGQGQQTQSQQPQQQQQQHPHHHQLHQHQPQQPQPHHQQQQQQQQQQTHHPHQQHQQTAQHHQHNLQQNHITATTTTTAIANAPGGVAVESQLKNLLFNLLLKDGQHPVPMINQNQDCSKQRNDMLAIIASSLTKIEGHLSKISKVASLFAQTVNGNQTGNGSTAASLSNPNNNNLNDGNNNSLNISGNNSSAINNQSGSEA